MGTASVRNPHCNPELADSTVGVRAVPTSQRIPRTWGSSQLSAQRQTARRTQRWCQSCRSATLCRCHHLQTGCWQRQLQVFEAFQPLCCICCALHIAGALLGGVSLRVCPQRRGHCTVHTSGRHARRHPAAASRWAASCNLGKSTCAMHTCCRKLSTHECEHFAVEQATRRRTRQSACWRRSSQHSAGSAAAG
jgi:hypothetical protein